MCNINNFSVVYHLLAHKIVLRSDFENWCQNSLQCFQVSHCILWYSQIHKKMLTNTTDFLSWNILKVMEAVAMLVHQRYDSIHQWNDWILELRPSINLCRVHTQDQRHRCLLSLPKVKKTFFLQHYYCPFNTIGVRLSACCIKILYFQITTVTSWAMKLVTAGMGWVTANQIQHTTQLRWLHLSMMKR